MGACHFRWIFNRKSEVSNSNSEWMRLNPLEDVDVIAIETGWRRSQAASFWSHDLYQLLNLESRKCGGIQ